MEMNNPHMPFSEIKLSKVSDCEYSITIDGKLTQAMSAKFRQFHLEIERAFFGPSLPSKMEVQNGGGKKKISKCKKKKAGKNFQVNVYIDSGGGHALSGFRMYEVVREMNRRGIHTVGILESQCMSAANLILLACTERVVHKYSVFMLHQLRRSGSGGRASEMRDDIFNDALLEKKYKEIFLKHSKLTEKRYNDDYVNERWWDASLLLKLGIATKILP